MKIFLDRWHQFKSTKSPQKLRWHSVNDWPLECLSNLFDVAVRKVLFNFVAERSGACWERANGRVCSALVQAGRAGCSRWLAISIQQVIDGWPLLTFMTFIDHMSLDGSSTLYGRQAWSLCPMGPNTSDPILMTCVISTRLQSNGSFSVSRLISYN